MSKLDELLAAADKAKEQQLLVENATKATPVQSAVIQGISRLAGAPIDLPPTVASMFGADVQAPGATQQIQQGLEQAMGVNIQEDDTLHGDLITKFLTGAIETAPYAYAAAGPVLGTAGTVGAGVINAITDQPFFDDRPLEQFAIEFGPALLSPAILARAPRKGFDPQRPLTEGEAGTSPITAQDELLSIETAAGTSPKNIRTEQKRSDVFETTLADDLNILTDIEMTSVQAAREVGERLVRRQAALRRKLSSQADKIMADIPDVNINFKPIHTSILNKNTRGSLTEQSQRQALDLYAGMGANIKSINVKSLHEEMKRVGEVAYGNMPITETAFYRKLLNSGNEDAKQLAKILSEMPEQTLRTWGKTVYKNMNTGLTQVIKEGGEGVRAARGLADFKKSVSNNIRLLERLENEPLIKFFGDDFHTLDARQLSDVLNKTDPKKVKQFSAMLRKSNPEAYEKLRETVYHAWLDDFRIRGPQGRTMFDWNAMTDAKSLQRLKENGFLLEGGDYTALSQTMKALGKMQRKFDPDISGNVVTSPKAAQQALDGILQAARAPAYKGAIVAQGLIRIMRGLSLQNPKNLSLFNNAELQMMTRVINGEKLGKESAERLASKMHKLAGVMFVTPVTVTGGRSAAAQRPQEQLGTQTKLDTLLERAQGGTEAPSLFFSP